MIPDANSTSSRRRLTSPSPMAPPLPSNVHVSKHPCLRAKLALLRSQAAGTRETKALVNDIATILSIEALAGLEVKAGSTDVSPLGYEFTAETISPLSITLVPILRSGLGMVDALQIILPFPVSVHHLGLFRDPISLQPVEYYNNLPFTRPDSSSTPDNNQSPSQLAIVLDPVIATGGTAVAAIQTLKEWGVQKIIMLSVLGCAEGLRKVAEEWPEATDFWVAGIDEELNDRGMIRPGIGDIGDRLFLTVGK